MENLNMFELTKPTYKLNNPIRLIELFAGVGSQAMALRNIGVDFEHYRVVEFDKYAIQSYNAIHGTNFPTIDITQVTGEDLGIAETNKFTYIMTYSFPCQDLSLAGKRKGMSKDSNTRSGLLWEVERLLKESKYLPQILLMENVPQVIGQKNIHDFSKWESFLKKLGYSNYIDTLNAKDYGVAQNRNRTFMVSILGNYFYKFPKSIKLNKTIQHYLEEEVEEKFYLKNEKADKLIEQLIEKGQLENQSYADGSVNDPKVKKISNCIKARYDNGISNLKSEGGVIIDDTQNFDGVRKYEEYSPSLRSERSGLKTIEVKRLGNIYGEDKGTGYAGNVWDKEGVSPTITTMQGGNREPMIVASRGRNPDNPSDRTTGTYTEQRLEMKSDGTTNTITTVQKDNYLLEVPYRIRKLTPKECWRLMGFADEDFHKAEKVVSNSQLYKQAGNSIVVDVLEVIFKMLKEGLDES